MDINATIHFIEYKLNSLNPQIAMPDWNRKIEYTFDGIERGSYPRIYHSKTFNFTRKRDIEILENGYINAISIATDAASRGSVEVNGILVDLNSDSNNIDGFEANFIPVSKGDVVTLYSTENDYLSRFVDFYPCKSVPQQSEKEDILNLLYPVGSLYLDGNNGDICPLKAVITDSEWEEIGTKILTGGSTAPVVGNGKDIILQPSSGGSFHQDGGMATNSNGTINTRTDVLSYANAQFGSESGLVADLGSATSIAVKIWKRIS